MSPLLSLMHDTAHTIEEFKHKLKLFDGWNKEYAAKMKEMGLQADSKPFIIAEYFRSNIKKLTLELDTYYVEQKKIEAPTSNT